MEIASPLEYVEAIRLAPTTAPEDIYVVNVSGRGDKDMGILARELNLSGARAV